ncbi:MAG TPA: DUF4288 domain-containing protein [Vicinamibacterales bacterium]|jgi:hypothetical protein
MRKHPRIIGLDSFGLTRAALLRLGPRPVHLSIQLTGETVAKLWHLQPKQRDATLRETLAKQLNHLRRDFPAVKFVSRGKHKPSWTIDAVVPANQLAALASRPYVKDVMIDTIEGRRQRFRRSGLAWFCVWGVIAIQIEGQTKGSLDLEDRLVLVKANDTDDAQRRLHRLWTRHAEPYMNPDGYLVRWQLISIRDVYQLFDQAIDPRGTEVYSKLRKVRMRPEYRWRPEKRARVHRTSK